MEIGVIGLHGVIVLSAVEKVIKQELDNVMILIHNMEEFIVAQMAQTQRRKNIVKRSLVLVRV